MRFFDFLFNTNTNIRPQNNSTIEPTVNRTSKFQPFNEEFSLDLTTEPYGNDMLKANNSYSNSGVEIQDANNTLRLLYNGILAKSGANEIYAVIGYGNNLAWEDIEYYPMYKTGHQKFEVMLPINRTGNINIAFKDPANNWDNNSGLNYSFTNHVYEGSH